MLLTNGIHSSKTDSFKVFETYLEKPQHALHFNSAQKPLIVRVLLKNQLLKRQTVMLCTMNCLFLLMTKSNKILKNINLNIQIFRAQERGEMILICFNNFLEHHTRKGFNPQIYTMTAF